MREEREEKADSNSQAQNNSHLKMCHSSNTGEEWKLVSYVLLQPTTIGPPICQSEHN